MDPTHCPGAAAAQQNQSLQNTSCLFNGLLLRFKLAGSKELRNLQPSTVTTYVTPAGLYSASWAISNLLEVQKTLSQELSWPSALGKTSLHYQ